MSRWHQYEFRESARWLLGCVGGTVIIAQVTHPAVPVGGARSGWVRKPAVVRFMALEAAPERCRRLRSLN